MKQKISFALIAAYLGGRAIEGAQKGKPAKWATKLASLFGGKKREAIILSYALGAVGVWVGLRSMNSQQDYLSGGCGCGCGCTGSKHGLF